MFDVRVSAPKIRASMAMRSVKHGPIVPARFAAPTAIAKIITRADLKARFAPGGFRTLSA